MTGQGVEPKLNEKQDECIGLVFMGTVTSQFVSHSLGKIHIHNILFPIFF